MPWCFDPLPFPDAQQLVTVSVTSTRGGGPRPFSTGEYESLAEQVTGFADVAARSFMPVVLGRTRAGDEAQVVQSEVVSDNYFRMLSVPLLLGRDFGTEERRGAASVDRHHRPSTVATAL